MTDFRVCQLCESVLCDPRNHRRDWSPRELAWLRFLRWWRLEGGFIDDDGSVEYLVEERA